ncbi:SpvB/TcaC N-terminal domain-containing protein [Sorangium sp. So ce1014]|uniref:SpvB/TcaC N-terminal domain-containing protein n=1 Tax=Sorangium sp. So ce1014 TaxID=3133326 RepID=UPI003F647922
MVMSAPLQAWAQALTLRRMGEPLRARLTSARGGADLAAALAGDAAALVSAGGAAGAPEGLAVVPLAALPADVRVSGAGRGADAWRLFDGRADTGLHSDTGEVVRVRVTLAHPTALEAMALYGRSEGTLTVHVEDGAGLHAVPGLVDVPLRDTGERWTRFPLAVTAQHVVLEWHPSGERGPQEIVLWTAAAPTRGLAEVELADRVLAGKLAGAYQFPAMSERAAVTRTGGERSLSFHVDTDPRALARAFLVYELEGRGHWSSVSRQLNGAAPRGGFRAEAPSDGGLQVEEIAPAWLKRGDNVVRFRPPADHERGYAVRALRMVGIPHAGVFEARAAARSAGGERARRDGPLSIDFGARVAPHALLFQLAGAGAGEIEIAPGVGAGAKGLRFDLTDLSPGWHRLDLPVQATWPETASVQVRPAKGSRAEVSDVAVAVSPIPSRSRRIALSAPLHGECVDGRAYVRGFLDLPGEGASRARLFADAMPVELGDDGSFELTLSEPEAARLRTWRARLEARLEDGTRLGREVELGPCVEGAAASAAPGGLVVDEGAPYGVVVSPDEGAVLSFAGATLEIPAGALAQATRVTIRPLTPVQLQPMGRAMRNVTPEGRAFRLGPHGLRFRKPVKLTLPIDGERLPDGAGANEVFGFYFDESAKQWMKLGRAGEGRTRELTSLTDHFTDFVNATVAMPDQPGAQSFDPNAMKGIELASPSAGVSFIEPPEANSRGTAQIAYPIEVPPGRNGMEPGLAVTYESELVSGWLGVGWDLRLSAIEIDTRFGVPRYTGDELYALDGQMLRALPDQPGRYERRVEGAFDRIERLGADPWSYHWVVTDKNGTRYTYGESAGARLSDPSGDAGVFRWNLERVEDTFGNRMLVSYFEDAPEGAGWVQLYPQRIDYTEHESGFPGAHYHVHFLLDDGAQRRDILSSARAGFEVRTTRRLERIDVTLGEAPGAEEIIRSYDFAYDEPDARHYAKSLLRSIALQGNGDAGQLYEHTFEYFGLEQQDGRLQVFASPTEWSRPAEGRDGLGATSSIDGGLSVFVGAGPPICDPHGGLGVGVSFGADEEQVAFTDINGDGLPDFVGSNGVWLNALPDRSSPNAFSPESVGSTHQITASLQGAIHFFQELGGAGINRAWSTATAQSLLLDINGDGFPELLDGSGATLNPNNARLGSGARGAGFTVDEDFSDGEQVAELGKAFYRTSALVKWSPPIDGIVVIEGGVSLAGGGAGDGVTASITKAVASPRPGDLGNSDPLLLWQRDIGPSGAPCVPEGEEGCGSGIRVRVRRLDALYFRVDPREDIEGDSTRWSPRIRYVETCASGTCEPIHPREMGRVDALGRPLYIYDFADDFSVLDRSVPGWAAGADGQVTVQASFVRTDTDDAFDVRLVRQDVDSGERAELHRTTVSGAQLSTEISWPVAVLQGDILFLYAELSENRVDPLRVQYQGFARYTEVCGHDAEPGRCREVEACAERPGAPSGRRVCGLEALPGDGGPISVPEASIVMPVQLSDSGLGGAPLDLARLSMPESGTVRLIGSAAKLETQGPVSLRVDRGSERLFRELLGGEAISPARSVPGPSAPVVFPVMEGEELAFTKFFELEADLGAAPPEPGASVSWWPRLVFNETGTVLDVPVVNARAIPDGQLGARMVGGFRGFSYGEWTTEYPFNANQLNKRPEENKPPYFTRVEPHWEGYHAGWSPEDAGFPLVGSISGPVFRGSGADMYITAGELKPSRVGGVRPEDVANVPGLRKSHNGSASADVALIGSFQVTTGTTESKLELIDVNGDGRPDVVTRGGVRLQTCDGGRCDGQQPGEYGDLALDGPGDFRVIESMSARFGFGFGSAASAVAEKLEASGTTAAVLSVLPSLGKSWGTSQTTRDLLDVNGDGLPDKVRSAGGVLHVRLNLGYRFGDERAWAALDPSDDPFEPLPEVDGDPLTAMSRLWSAEQLSSMRVQDNTTNSLQVGYAGIGGGIAHTVSRTLADFVDLNGDGLPDRVSKQPGQDYYRVRLNLGDGFGPEEKWSAPAVSGGLPWGVRLEKDFTKEINGSNDALSFSETTAFNAGYGVPIKITTPYVCIVLEIAAQLGLNDGRSELGWNDLDGDGTVDHVLKLSDGMLRESDGALRARLNLTGKTNRLRRVVRPLGGSFELDYAREGNRVAYASSPDELSVDMPGSKWVLSQVEVDDGMGTPAYVHTFDYHQSGFYDRAEREDYGFAQVTATREDGSQLVTRYHNQDYYRRGLVAEVIEQDAEGRLFSRQQVAYRAPGAEPALTGSFFPEEELRTTSWYEGKTTDPSAPGKQTSEERDWDDRGNLIRLTEHGEPGTLDDDVTTTIHHVTYDGPHIVRADSVEARDSAGTLLRRRTAEYDELTGAVAWITSTVIGGKEPATGAPYTGDASTNPSWHFLHDAYGNLEHAIDPRGVLLIYRYDDVTETHLSAVEDAFGHISETSTDYRYGAVSAVRDVNGHEVYYGFDGFGRLTEVFGPNDAPMAAAATIAFEYALQPGASPAVPAWARTRHKDVQHPGDPIDTVTFIDGLDRVIQTKKDLEKDQGPGAEPLVGMTVSGRVVLDERGRVALQGQPVFDTGEATVFVDVPLKHPTVFEHDVLSRVVEQREPDDGAEAGEAVTTTSYDIEELDGVARFVATEVDPSAKVRKAYQDVDNAIVAVEERNRLHGSETWTTLATRYRYNAAGELVRVTDALGNVTTAEYDTVGRMVALASPDMGRTEWRYDASGNVRTRQTAKLAAEGASKLIRYEYEDNRLSGVDYPDSTDVTYEYGAPSEAGDEHGNRAGRLKEERSEAGKRTFAYDRLGNVAQLTTEFPRLREPHRGPYEATMEYAFDSFGRLLSMKFPGSGAEVVTYGYDRGGLVRSAVGMNTQINPQHPDEPVTTQYLLHIGYDEFEQRVRVVHGNGIATAYRYYEKSRRLEQVNADHRDRYLVERGRPARPFQRMRYVYDAAGNLEQVRNEAPYEQEMPGSVRVGPTTQEYGYDDLYQLVSAKGTYQDARDWQYRYGLSLDYDEIGNILTKDQANYRYVPDGVAGTSADLCEGDWCENNPIREQTYRSEYRYTGPQPHAPRLIDEHLVAESDPWPRMISYDASGNQTGWVYRSGATRTTEWNEENRVSRVSQNGQELSRMLYDGDGARRVHLHRVSGEEETAYHDQHLTLRDGRFVTKHIYAGQTRIASKMDPDWFRDPPTLYYHPDHLGSTSFASNNEQTLTQRDEYFPTGELWIDASDSRYELRRAYVFTGKELDQATGLYYFGARYYDARINVWLSPDPILDEYMAGGPGAGVFNPGNLGLYSYALNNPVNLVDPDGRQTQGGHRNFPPGGAGMGGCRTPSCWTGPEGARFHRLIQTQRMAEQQAQGKAPVSPAAAPPRTVRMGGVNQEPVLPPRPAGQPQAAPPKPAATPAQAGQPAKPPQPAKPAQAAPSAKPAQGAAKQPASSTGAARGAPKLHMGQQGKHIPGHNNYTPGRSPFTHRDPQGLLNRFAGKGDPVGKVPRGQPGFKERVDFGEVIGQVNGQATTKGIIHYSKDGVHIVPANP